MTEYQISLCLKGDPDIYEFTIRDNKLSLDTITRYFQFATGLKYKKDGKVVCLELDLEGNFSISSQVKDYEVVCSDTVGCKSLIETIKEYFFLRYTYKEICLLMKEEKNIDISERTLKRILREHNLKRKNIIESPVEELVGAIMNELESCGYNLGYRSLWQRLKDTYQLIVKQTTVLKILNVIDPSGVEARSRYRLKRRKYRVPGPNYLWHVDGFDKLKQFGFAIHGCVDGFSRKVIWLEVSTTNNDPSVIAYYYLKALRHLQLVPTKIRSDRGTENTLIDQIQIALRYDHTDVDAGEESFIKGKSTANERIEKYWNHLRKHSMNFYIRLFKEMQNQNILDTSIAWHIELLRFCFGDLIVYSLYLSQKEWNEHRVRSQKLNHVPCGIPNVIYKCPEIFNGVECKKQLDLRKIRILMENYATVPVVCKKIVVDMIHQIKPDVSRPQSVEEAYNLFIQISNIVKL